MKVEKIINKDLKTLAEDNQKNFINNKPFSHIMFENFFNEDFLTEILNNFPDLEKMDNSMEFNTKSDKKKFATNLEFNYPEKIHNFISFLNSYQFINFLQKLTGIEEKLIPDPYFFGGGLHQIKKGGFLKVHADFNYHPQMKLDRRLNVLIYLNKNWKDDYGGSLQLWDSKMTRCEKKILPVFNKSVIFSTTDLSYHGNPDKINHPENISRKSIAMYYYTNGRPSNEINFKLGESAQNTLYQKRDGHEDNFDRNRIEFKKIFGKFYIRKKINY